MFDSHKTRLIELLCCETMTMFLLLMYLVCCLAGGNPYFNLEKSSVLQEVTRVINTSQSVVVIYCV